MKTFLSVFFIILGGYLCYCTGLAKGQEERLLQTRELAKVDTACGIDLNMKKTILVGNILMLQHALMELESDTGLQLDM